MPSSAHDIGTLQTLIDNVTFNDTKQDEQSHEGLCLGYRRVTFFVDIAAAGDPDDTIELQVYLQVWDETNWHDVVDGPFSAWEYDHSQVANAPRPGSAQLREALSWEVSAPKLRIDVRSTETTAVKTLTLTIKAIGVP